MWRRGESWTALALVMAAACGAQETEALDVPPQSYAIAAENLAAHYASSACLENVESGRYLCEFFNFHLCESTSAPFDPVDIALVPSECQARLTAHDATEGPRPGLGDQWCVIGPHVEGPLRGSTLDPNHCAESEYAMGPCSGAREVYEERYVGIGAGACTAYSMQATFRACIQHFCGIEL